LEIAVAFVDLGELSQKAFDLVGEALFDPKLIHPPLQMKYLSHITFFR
jgi:hypothetical protein